MESLKEFSVYTRKSMSVKYSYAVRRNAIALGMTSELLVENAGEAVSDSIKRRMKGDKVLIVCGAGEKGAIGLATARHLSSFCEVRVVLLGEHEEIRNAATKFNLKMLEGLIEVEEIAENSYSQLASALKWSDVVLEAIIGIGAHGRITGIVQGAIQEISKSKKRVISIDIPAGVNGDTGETNTSYVRADELLAFHKLKKGMVKSKAVGSIVQLDVGIPLLAELATGPGDFEYLGVGKGLDSNKYSNGSLLVVGGSKSYRGAPLMAGFGANAAYSALRSGSGYVTVAVPQGAAYDSFGLLPDLIVKELPEGEREVATTIAGIKHNVIVVGPGIEKSEVGFGLVNGVVREEASRKNIVVLDAGAIGVVKEYKNMLNRRMILTPHDGEFRELTGIRLSGKSLRERIHAAINFAKGSNCTVVLKGHETIITNGERLKINMAKSAALATMGTGDVLDGVIGSFAASTGKIFESAVAGVYIHSLAGDRLAERMGDGVTAHDVIEEIPKVIKEFRTL